MSTAAAATFRRAAPPDTTRVWARATATRIALTNILALAFQVIKHGKALAFMFRDHAGEPGHGLAGRLFGAGDIDVIVTCMRRGVMRAVALHRVLSDRIARPPCARWPALCPRDPAPPGQDGANVQPDAPAKLAAPKWWQTCGIAYLPTEDEAADEARRRPAGAIMADIYLDFGMTPENAGALWDELLVLMRRFGGSKKRFLAEVDRRKAPASHIGTPRFGGTPEPLQPGALSAEEQSRDPAPPQQTPAGWSPPEAASNPASRETFEPAKTVPARHWPVSPPPAREVAATAPP